MHTDSAWKCQKIIKEDYHFSDYEIENIVNERRNILIENYKDFAQKLLEKLSQKNSVEEVDSFIQEYVVKIKTELYFVNEYEIFTHGNFGSSFFFTDSSGCVSVGR